MRSVFALFFLVLYSVSNFGLSLRLDLCGSSISGIGLYADDSKVSECCVKYTMEDDCCNSKQVFLQDDSDKAQPGEIHQSPVVSGFLAVLPTPLFIHKPLNSKIGFCQQANAPPLGRNSVHILNSCFLIWDRLMPYEPILPHRQSIFITQIKQNEQQEIFISIFNRLFMQRN